MTTPKPIPDAVLRRLVDVLAAGDTLTFLTSAGHESISAKGAFLELLALRQAARDVVAWRDHPAREGMFEADECGHCGKANAEPFDALRALLPEEPS